MYSSHGGFPAFLDDLASRTMRGQRLTKEEILCLLEQAPESQQGECIRAKAHDMAVTLTHNTGRIWSAVGIEHRPCPMNCDFCSFGEKWDLVKNGSEWSDEDILSAARRSVQGGATWFALRTNEFFSVDRLTLLSRKIRNAIRELPFLVVNTGELSVEEANELNASGVTGAYHTLRMGEGKNTRFSPSIRIKTLKALQASKLQLYQMIEPLGPEHGNDEIADRLMLARDCDAALGGVMARINVRGTPFGDSPPLSESRLAHVIAVSRICGGNSTPDICVLPPNLSALKAGANVVTVEVGSIPRSETTEHSTEWNDFGMAQAHKILRQAGYSTSQPV